MQDNRQEQSIDKMIPFSVDCLGNELRAVLVLIYPHKRVIKDHQNWIMIIGFLSYGSRSLSGRLQVYEWYHRPQHHFVEMRSQHLEFLGCLQITRPNVA